MSLHMHAYNVYIYITTYIFMHQYVSLHIIIDHYASSYTIILYILSIIRLDIHIYYYLLLSEPHKPRTALI